MHFGTRSKGCEASQVVASSAVRSGRSIRWADDVEREWLDTDRAEDFGPVAASVIIWGKPPYGFRRCRDRVKKEISPWCFATKAV